MSEATTWHRPYQYERPPFGEFGSLAMTGDRVVCHVCGRDYKALGPHIWRMHGMLAAEYKDAFRLNSTVALCGAPTSKRLSEVNAKYEAAKHLVKARSRDDPRLRSDALRASRISAERRQAGLSHQYRHGGFGGFNREDVIVLSELTEDQRRAVLAIVGDGRNTKGQSVPPVPYGHAAAPKVPDRLRDLDRA